MLRCTLRHSRSRTAQKLLSVDPDSPCTPDVVDLPDGLMIVLCVYDRLCRTFNGIESNLYLPDHWVIWSNAVIGEGVLL